MAKTLTHEQADAAMRKAIKKALDAGARPEDLRILWNGHEWRWSAVLRRWDIYDPTAGLPPLQAETE